MTDKLFLPDEAEVQRYIDEQASSDDRLRAIELAIAVEAEIRNSKALGLILDYVQTEAAAALEELAAVSPGNTEKIMELQAIVYRARVTMRTLNLVLQKGRVAEKSLIEERG
jgi:hypothetical protein